LKTAGRSFICRHSVAGDFRSWGWWLKQWSMPV
jgi:hypothetical protein